MQNHDDQKRKYYRLKYPVKALPRVRINGDVYHVNEVSEGGLRVTLSSIHQFHQGLMIRERCSCSTVCWLSKGVFCVSIKMKWC